MIAGNGSSVLHCTIISQRIGGNYLVVVLNLIICRRQGLLTGGKYVPADYTIMTTMCHETLDIINCSNFRSDEVREAETKSEVKTKLKRSSLQLIR